MNLYCTDHQPRTLRDEFAMAILPAVLTAYKDHCREECLKGGNGSIHEIAAEIAYAYADAQHEVCIFTGEPKQRYDHWRHESTTAEQLRAEEKELHEAFDAAFKADPELRAQLERLLGYDPYAT